MPRSTFSKKTHPAKTPKHSKPSSSHSLNSSPTTHTRMTPYVSFFAIGYVLATTIFMLIQTKLALSAQLVTVVSILVGAFIAVHKFIKHQQRALNHNEINRLSIASVGAVWLLTAIYLVGLWLLLFDEASRSVLLEMSTQQPLPLLGVFMLILVLTMVSARLGIWLFNRLLTPK